MLSSQLACLQRPFVPFVGVVALAFSATVLQVGGTEWWLVVAAGVGAVVVGLVGVVVPWSVLPGSALLALPMAADMVIALLRQAQGGSSSGYGPLVILPVVWVGLTQRRGAVAVICCCTALVFALPIVIVGAPLYPSSGWRSVVLWAVVSVAIGLGANRAVAHHRRQADVNRARALGLSQLVEVQTTIASPDLPQAALMTAAAEGALALTMADGACIELLEGDEIICGAVAGASVADLGLHRHTSASLVGECLQARQIVVCSDSGEDTSVHREACRLLGARSLILVPLVHGDDVKGVLLVWSATLRDFQGYESQLLALLANVVGGALVRAELFDRLTDQAVTDDLTGLANRRAWYHQLDYALARARRTGQPLSILILDLDDFKRINDHHGHDAGDRALKTVTTQWTSALRATDLLGRIGGDEFAVILEMTNATAAHEVIARLHRAIADHHSASTGLAVWNGIEDATTLIARADTDMYRHKRTPLTTTSRATHPDVTEPLPGPRAPIIGAADTPKK
jgi:diguanylate cyclase (GGDEF)-like protein